MTTHANFNATAAHTARADFVEVQAGYELDNMLAHVIKFAKMTQQCRKNNPANAEWVAAIARNLTADAAAIAKIAERNPVASK